MDHFKQTLKKYYILTFQYIKREVEILKKLGMGNYRHFCKLIDWRLDDKQDYNYLIMQLGGKSLRNLRLNCRTDGRFSLYFSLAVGYQILQALHDLHEAGFVHIDIKPDNVLYSLDQQGLLESIHLIDFSLARKYIDRNGNIKPPKFDPGFHGTVMYMSLNAHKYMRSGLGMTI